MSKAYQNHSPLGGEEGGSYTETIEYLYNAAPAFTKVGASAYKEGLANTLALDEHAGHPHRSFLTVHVAGTNGKGSCSHTLAAILQAAKVKVCDETTDSIKVNGHDDTSYSAKVRNDDGTTRNLRVGLFTSPHLITFRERIRVNGEMITEQYVIDWVARNREFFEQLQPSFFELSTAMAFEYFRDQKVDIAVIEVGLGGRLDCTNIITPILSVITNISFDHTQFLGDTLAKIAGEKAGIIKPNTPVIIGEYTAETRPVFEAKSHEMAAPIIFAEDNNVSLDCDYELKGSYQQKNRNTILNCLVPLARQLRKHGIYVTDATSTVKHAFENVCTMTGLMGRWQTLQHAPLVICDTGHNVAGWEYLSQQIRETYEAVLAASRNSGSDKINSVSDKNNSISNKNDSVNDKDNSVSDKDACNICSKHTEGKDVSPTLRIVFGMVDDKDINTVLSMLPKGATYYFTQASTHRAIPVGQLSEFAADHSITGKCFDTVAAAYSTAIADARKQDFIFVGGSSYIVADLLTAIQ